MGKRRKRGYYRAKRMTLPLGAEFVLRYSGAEPAGWEVVRTTAEGTVIRRVVDMETGEVLNDAV